MIVDPEMFLTALDHYPPGAKVSVTFDVEDLRSAVQHMSESLPTEWVGTSQAAALTGLSATALRSHAARWWGHRNPPIRVRKNDPDNPDSNWLYARADCEIYGTSGKSDFQSVR